MKSSLMSLLALPDSIECIIMGLRPLEIFLLFQCRDQLQTSTSI